MEAISVSFYRFLLSHYFPFIAFKKNRRGKIQKDKMPSSQKQNPKLQRKARTVCGNIFGASNQRSAVRRVKVLAIVKEEWAEGLLWKMLLEKFHFKAVKWIIHILLVGQTGTRYLWYQNKKALGIWLSPSLLLCGSFARGQVSELQVPHLNTFGHPQGPQKLHLQ